MFKRVWLWRLRSRSQIKPAVLVTVCLAASIFVLDNSMTARSAPRGHLSYPEDTTTTSTTTSTTTTTTTTSTVSTPPPSLQHSHSDAARTMNSHSVITTLKGASDRLEANIESDKTTGGRLSNERLLIFSENVRKHGKNKDSGVILNDDIHTQIGVSGESRVTDIKGVKKSPSPSFGFVNRDFKPPPPRERRGGGGLMDIIQGFMKGGSLLGPGNLLGAIAALKQFETVNHKQSKDEIQNDSKVPPAGIPRDPGRRHSGNREQEPGLWEGSGRYKDQAENTKDQDGQDRLSAVQKPYRPTSDESRGRGKQDGMPSRGQGGSPVGSVLGSLISNLGPMLLSSGRTKNDRQMEGASAVSHSNNFQALMGGLGPLFLAGFGGLGGKRRGPDSPSDSVKMNSLHTIMSQVGSSLMAEAALHPNSKVPLQSLFANLGPPLLSFFTQGNGQSADRKGTENSSPVQAILGGLLPLLNPGMSQQSGLVHGRDRNRLPQSPIQSIVNGMGQSILKNQTGLGGLLAGMAPVLMSGAARRGSRTLQEVEVDAEAGSDYNGVASSGGLESEGGRQDASRAAVKLLVRAAASSLLPEELPVPEINSTRSLWDMTVNLAFGNPRNLHERNSRFWQWVKAYMGDESRGSSRISEDFTPAWVTAALTANTAQREASARTLTKLYQRLEDPQPLCQHVRSLGGLFNWRTGVLVNARDVCMDADVAPRSKGCMVYSFGVKDEWSFEEDMEDIGCEVWAFDPTMTTGNHNHSSAIHFYNLGLASSSAPTTVTKKGQRWYLFPLAGVMKRLGHATSTIDYLKMDIGGSEWQVLHETATHSRHALTNLRQLGVEVHLEAALRDPSLYTLYLDVLEGLEGLGFQLFSSNATQRHGWTYHDPLLGRRVSLHYDLVFLRV